MYTCLFSGGGLDLKTSLRNGASDADIQALATRTWTQRADRYSELRTTRTEGLPRVEMFHIGG